jgi:CheY-like chemotaxis protein
MDQLEIQGGSNRVDPENSQIAKQRAHMIRKRNKTPLACRHIKASHRRIMVVDDEEGIREILSTALSSMGYEVVTANSGGEALNLFLKSSFALVLTDLEMPGMDGWNLASRIKDRSPNIPVVVMTGQSQEDVMERMKGNSVNSAIFKPFRLEQVLKMIEKLLATELSRKSTPGSWNNPAADQRTSA